RMLPFLRYFREELMIVMGTVAGCLALLGMALWLRPWRTD
ncbi:hypothetical protein K3Z93_29805, partial [Pseudomonas aeruginosa]|nr:hypothetical protein [Pseudomonas aeruginosa]